MHRSNRTTPAVLALLLTLGFASLAHAADQENGPRVPHRARPHVNRGSQTTSRAVGGDAGHGGHLIELDGSSGDGEYQLWDYVEGGEAFAPTDLPEYSIIRAQLQKIGQTLPQTAALLENILSSGAVQWRWVKPELKSVAATGNTWLRVTDKRRQIAISDSRHQTIQIAQELYAGLDPKVRPYVIFHELMWAAETMPYAYSLVNRQIVAVWNAEEPVKLSLDNPYRRVSCSSETPDVVVFPDITSTSETVRNLTTYFMAPNWASPNAHTAEGGASNIASNTGSVNSKSANASSAYAYKTQDHSEIRECDPAGWNTMPMIAKLLEKAVPNEMKWNLLHETQNMTPLAVAATIDRELAAAQERKKQ